MSSDIRIGPWLVQPDLNRVSDNGTSTRLEPKVMAVLLCLAEHPGEVVVKEQLLQTVWPDTFVTDDVLKRSVSELRRVFNDDARESQFIETIPKRGYRLLARVEPVNGSATNIQSPKREAAAATPERGRRNLRKAAAAALASVLLLSLGVGGILRRVRNDRVAAIRSLAVLPLQSLSDDPKLEYLAEGMTDLLITDLAQLRGLRVVSRTTIMGYGRPSKSMPQIARELKVDGIVEGTVQRSGDRVRITAQLIHGPSDQHVWSNSFERELKDVLELQSTVASEIASQIQVRITPEEKSKLDNVRPVNPRALDAYVEARYHLDEAAKLEHYKGKRQQEANELRKAVSCLDSAIQQDANYLPAYVTYFEALESRSEHLEYLPKAKAALKKALELDPTNVPAHLALGRLLMQFEYDWAGAEREYKRAIELNPTSADAQMRTSTSPNL